MCWCSLVIEWSRSFILCVLKIHLHYRVREVRSASLLGHILYDVYFICSSSLPMDSVRYIANRDVLCFLPSETAFWRLARNEHPSLVGRTRRETVTAKVHAERNAELLKRSLRNPASAQRSLRSLIACPALEAHKQ